LRPRQHKWNLEVSHLERSRLAQHSFEENHHVLWEEVKILETEKLQYIWSIRKRPTWHVYKILLADPASKFLPSGTIWSGMNCLSNMFWSPEDSQLLHSWCFVLQCMCYGFDDLNICCVSGTILWVSWLFLNFSAAFSCYNARLSSVLRSLPTLESDSVVPSDWE
jgi:hypothetical protein